MSALFLIATIACTVMVVYQGYVSWCVAHASHSTREQRLLQLVTIWILPLLGAILCHLMLREMSDPIQPLRAESDSVDSAGGDGSSHGETSGD